jgi:steroid delta-isomerase-like uncharacterized protein
MPENTESRAQARALIEAYYAAFNAGNGTQFLSMLTDDVAHDVNQGGRDVGVEAFRSFMERMNLCYEERIHGLEIFVSEDGKRAATEYIVDGVYKTTDSGLPEARGQRYSVAGGAFFDVRGGKVARVTNYYNLERWLEQVG